MNLIETIILGIVQGLTEFLPISSSGHLVIFQKLLGIYANNIAFEVFVHFGTLLSVLVIYYRDITQMISSFCQAIFHKNRIGRFQQDANLRWAIYIIVGTLPAVIVGLLFNTFIEQIFHSTRLVGIALIVTALVLFLTRFLSIENKNLSVPKSLLIGFAQMIAILPGISRSGFTISAGLFSGINRNEAARFSFLLALPAILGATLLKLKDLLTLGLQGLTWLNLIVGLLIAFLVGYLAIRFLLRIIQSGKFSWFAPYCLVLGGVVLLFLN